MPACAAASIRDTLWPSHCTSQDSSGRARLVSSVTGRFSPDSTLSRKPSGSSRTAVTSPASSAARASSGSIATH